MATSYGPDLERKNAVFGHSAKACLLPSGTISPIFLLSYGDLSKFTHALIEKTDLMTL